MHGVCGLNPISVSAVPLDERQGNVIHVHNLDVFDGTPVLDIKPYLVRGDCYPDAQGPDWLYRLWAIRDAQRQRLGDAPLHPDVDKVLGANSHA